MVMSMESIERIGSWIPVDSHIIVPVTGSVGGGLPFELPKLVTSKRVKKVPADVEVVIAANKNKAALKYDRFLFIESFAVLPTRAERTGSGALGL